MGWWREEAWRLGYVILADYSNSAGITGFYQEER